MLLFIIPFQGFARHIIGGEFIYECLGDDRYHVILKVYRDCAAGGAEFDSYNPGSPGSITGTVSIYLGNSGNEFKRILLPSPSVTRLDPDVSACLEVPPGVCVEEGIYTFNVTLPKSPESYFLVYQRCCRNNTITNILNPGESGATYFIELTPDAQQLCNNSLVFKDFPPIVLCVGEPLIFDHSARDPDGNTQLTYEFCAPLLGGGLDGVNGGDPFGPTGVAPDPDEPPPYDPVLYVIPDYSANKPMGGFPQISINPNTGVITGTPTEIGQFVVGVCVKEYHNGKLISELRRDFQFNVTECQRLVNAKIEADYVSFGTYFIELCGDLDYTFENISNIEQYINNYSWEVNVGGAMLIYSEKNPSVHFPGVGRYHGSLVVNKNEGFCSDSLNFIVDIFPDIEAEFSYMYDTCVAGPVTFTNESVSGSGFITDYYWDFGDDNSSTDKDPIHDYLIPGELPAQLIVQDTNSCTDTVQHIINYFPAPAIIVVEPNTFIGCTPADIEFLNLSYPIDDSYDIVWDFGDGQTDDAISPTHTYTDPGLFSVGISITSPIGCYIDAYFPDWILIKEAPIAQFDYSPKSLDQFNKLVEFTDQSSNTSAWRWEFGNESISNLQNPTHEFRDTGMYLVKQIVFHENGCTDTLIAKLDVIPIIKYFLPNAFTPNADGTHDKFRAAGFFEGIRSFDLSIWNRWGEQVYSTQDPYDTWNGRKYNTGELLPLGVYICQVNYQEPRGKWVQLRTVVTLLQ